MSENMERKVIQTKSRHTTGDHQWMLEVQEAILDGWRVVDNGVRADLTMRNFMGRIGKVVLYKKVEGSSSEVHDTDTKEDVSADVTVEVQLEDHKETENDSEVKDDSDSETQDQKYTKEDVESLGKIEDVREFVSKHEIEVPDNLKNAKSIKNYLLKQLPE